MWVAAKDVRVGDFLASSDMKVITREIRNGEVILNNLLAFRPGEAVDINPIYKVTGPGTYRMRPNLTRADIQKYVDEGLEVSRVD